MCIFSCCLFVTGPIYHKRRQRLDWNIYFRVIRHLLGVTDQSHVLSQQTITDIFIFRKQWRKSTDLKKVYFPSQTRNREDFLSPGSVCCWRAGSPVKNSRDSMSAPAVPSEWFMMLKSFKWLWHTLDTQTRQRQRCWRCDSSGVNAVLTFLTLN